MLQSQGALTVKVSSAKAYMPRDPSVPIEYSEDVTEHPEITANKCGGNSVARPGMMSP